MYLEERAVIAKGLKVGDVIITAGQQKITPTSTIKILPSPKPISIKKERLEAKEMLKKLDLTPQISNRQQS